MSSYNLILMYNIIHVTSLILLQFISVLIVLNIGNVYEGSY